MTIKEFCQSRNVSQNTVSMYMSRNKKLFQGHKKTIGKTVQLDSTAIELLSEKYPLPEVIEVIEAPDEALKTKVMQLQDVIIKLQAQQAELQAKAALADAQSLLLEDRNNRIQELETEKEAAAQRAEALQVEIDRLKNRNLWNRIRNT